MILNRAITISVLVGGVVCVLVALYAGSAILAVVASVLFVLSLLLWKYAYLIIPVFTRATNIVEVRGAYEVPPSRDVVVKKTSNGYYATKFLEVRFYESTMDKTNSEKTIMFEAFEKTISSLKYIVKICLMVSTVDLSKHIEDIKTQRSAAETKKAKEGGSDSSDKITRLDRQIAMWSRQLDRITHGERPVEVIAYATTTAFGLTRDEALSRVTRQSKELKTILSSSLSCDITDLVDLDMLRCFEWEYFFPTNMEELRDEVF